MSYYRFCKSWTDLLTDFTGKYKNNTQAWLSVKSEGGDLFISIDVYSQKPIEKERLKIHGEGFDRIMLFSEKLGPHTYMTNLSTKQIERFGMLTLSFDHPQSKDSLNVSWYDGIVTDNRGYTAKYEGDVIEEIISPDEIKAYMKVKEASKKISEEGPAEMIEALQSLREVEAQTARGH